VAWERTILKISQFHVMLKENDLTYVSPTTFCLYVSVKKF